MNAIRCVCFVAPIDTKELAIATQRERRKTSVPAGTIEHAAHVAPVTCGMHHASTQSGGKVHNSRPRCSRRDATRRERSAVRNYFDNGSLPIRDTHDV